MLLAQAPKPVGKYWAAQCNLLPVFPDISQKDIDHQKHKISLSSLFFNVQLLQLLILEKIEQEVHAFNKFLFLDFQSCETGKRIPATWMEAKL